jgi:hypothetical protein
VRVVVLDVDVVVDVVVVLELDEALVLVVAQGVALE